MSIRARQAVAAASLRRPSKGLFQADRHFCGYSRFAIDLGQAYIDAYMDKDGAALDGAETYRLCVPAKNFWCITIYDVSTRGLIDDKQLR